MKIRLTDLERQAILSALYSAMLARKDGRYITVKLSELVKKLEGVDVVVEVERP